MYTSISTILKSIQFVSKRDITGELGSPFQIQDSETWNEGLPGHWWWRRPAPRARWQSARWWPGVPCRVWQAGAVTEPAWWCAEGEQWWRSQPGQRRTLKARGCGNVRKGDQVENWCETCSWGVGYTRTGWVSECLDPGNRLVPCNRSVVFI